MADNTKKNPTCEDLIDERMKSRLDQIMPEFDSLDDCFNYWNDYNHGVLENFLKDANLDHLIEEWKEEDTELALEEWLWEYYENDIVEFMQEFRMDRMNELLLGQSKTIQYRLELGTGGPADFILLDWDPENECWNGGEYHYQDWYDGARRTFNDSVAEQIAETFGIYPESE